MNKHFLKKKDKTTDSGNRTDDVVLTEEDARRQGLEGIMNKI